MFPVLDCFPEGKRLAASFDAKFIETSAGIQHNIDQLLVGVLKQIRLKGEQSSKPANHDDKPALEVGSTSSPLKTLQLARDILSKICISPKDSPPHRIVDNLLVP